MVSVVAVTIAAAGANHTISREKHRYFIWQNRKSNIVLPHLLFLAMSGGCWLRANKQTNSNECHRTLYLLSSPVSLLPSHFRSRKATLIFNYNTIFHNGFSLVFHLLLVLFGSIALRQLSHTRVLLTVCVCVCFGSAKINIRSEKVHAHNESRRQQQSKCFFNSLSAMNSNKTIECER